MILPSPSLSTHAIRPVTSQFLNHSGALWYSTSCRVLIMLVLAKAATAGAVV